MVNPLPINITHDAPGKRKITWGIRRLYLPLFTVPDHTHPLFMLERKHSRWAQTPERARKHSRRYHLRLVLILVLLWVGAVFVLGAQNSVAGSYRTYQPYLSVGAELLMLAFVISIGLSFLVDLATVAFTMNSINQETTLKRWDLLRLASEESLLLAVKYQLARLRSWRAYLLLISTRIAVILMFLLQITVVEYVETGRVLDGFIEAFLDYPLPSLLATGTLLLFAAGYIIEPFWRVRTVAALGLMISAYVRRVASAATFGFFALVIFWLSQAVLVAIYVYSLITIAEFISTFIYDLFNYYYDDGTIMLLLFFIYFIAALIIIRLFYQIIQRIALHRTSKRLD